MEPVDGYRIQLVGSDRRHLKSVFTDLDEDPQFQLAAIGINFEVSDYYSKSMQLDSDLELTGNLPRFSTEVLLDLK